MESNLQLNRGFCTFTKEIRNGKISFYSVFFITFRNFLSFYIRIGLKYVLLFERFKFDFFGTMTSFPTS